jgi:DNA-binding NarL/FixJ family response regulator
MERKIKVSVYEDNNSLRDSLSKLITAFPEFELTGAYPNALHILENIGEAKPDVILMDIDMPCISGIAAVAMVHKKYPDIKVIMQTVFDNNDKIFGSICAGAVGYMLKKTAPQDILDGIREGYKGGAPITPSVAVKILSMFKKQAAPEKNKDIDLSERETEILSHLTKGLSYKMIAHTCSISLDTVRFHIKNIYEKLHVHSMTEAVSKAIKEKLV